MLPDNERTSDAQPPLSPLEWVVEASKKDGALFVLARDHARRMGVSDEAALDNLAGNAVSAIAMSASLAAMGRPDMLVDQIERHIDDCDADRAAALKKPVVRGHAPDKRYPDGAISFYNRHWHEFTQIEEGRHPTLATDYGAQLTTNDIEQALIADLAKQAAREAKTVLMGDRQLQSVFAATGSVARKG